MKSIGSRDNFVDQVARAIKVGDGDREAFIFGISGRWGEGKSFFLDKLKQKLLAQNQHNRVIELHPWKYAHDDDSILRELLREMVKLQDIPFDRFMLSRKLNGLYRDVTTKTINIPLTIAVIAIALVVVYLYKFPPYFLVGFMTFISENKAFAVAILVPILLAVANAITTSQLSTKAVFTRDRFDEIFDEVFESIKVNKLVVYVDDLDRLTAAKALNVLDSLRTFFDKKGVAFIVASDHTVLERHLGRELRPEAGAPEQLEEGRRFLKKIFNVYWRLPLPTRPEYEDYIEGKVGERANPFVYKALLNEESRKLLKSYMVSYFSNNFRNGERFIKRIDFTFRLITAQSKSAETTDENREYFNEMLENPMLVIRILLIEELANPLFESIQHRPDLLLILEKFATDTDYEHDDYKKIIKDLSPEQQLFIRSFLEQKPRFHDESGIRVKSVEPYIFLSSDSSFGDIRGLSPQDFLRYLMEDQVTDLVEILKLSGEGKILEAMEYSRETFDTMTGEQKFTFLENLITVIAQIDSSLPAYQILRNATLKLDLTFIDERTGEDKMAMYLSLGRLDLSEAERQTIINATAEFTAMEWQIINTVETIPFLAQQKFLRYFKTYFQSQPGDAISTLGANLSKFDGSRIKLELSDFASALINYFVSDHNDDRRRFGMDILRQTDDGLNLLRDTLDKEMLAKNRPVINWAIQDARSSSQPLYSDIDEIVDVLMDTAHINSTSDIEDRLAIFTGTPDVKDRLWKSLFAVDEDLLLNALFDMAIYNSYAVLAPSKEYAEALVTLIIKTFVTKDRASEPRTYDWLSRIAPQFWLFSNLKITAKLNALINSKQAIQYPPENIKNELERIKNAFEKV